MSEQQHELTALISRLCEHHGVADQAALFETEAFQKAYVREHNRAPGVSVKSLMAKALRSMRNVQKTGVDIQAHCIEPHYEVIRWNKEERDNVCEALGILVATPEGETKVVKMLDYDPLTPLEDQFTAMPVPAGLTRASPITLRKVDTFQDLLDGTTRITITAESSIELGGHALPFPEGPDLERVIGETAFKKNQGAWKRNKKFGVITGSFGDIDGDPRVWVGTVTNDIDPQSKALSVRNFEDDDPKDWHVHALVYDRKGNGCGVKFFAEHIEQLGLNFSMPREAIIAGIRGQRVLLRGQGSVFMPKSVEDFDTEDVTGVFEARVKELQEEGYIVGYGEKGRVRLNLTDKWAIEKNEDGSEERVPQLFVKVGDKKVYDIVQVKEDKDGKPIWEISVLAADEQKLPWFSIKTSSGTWTDSDGNEQPWHYNRNGFCLFLDGSLAGSAEVKEDDPFMLAVAGMPEPDFIQRLRQTDITQPPVAQPAPAKPSVPPEGSRLVNGPPATKNGTAKPAAVPAK